MGILFASNNQLNWGNTPLKETNTLYRNTARVDHAFKLFNNSYHPMADFHPAPSGDTVYYSFLLCMPGAVNAGDDGRLIKIFDSAEVLLAVVDLQDGNLAAEVYGDTTVKGVQTVSAGEDIKNEFKIKLTVNASEITLTLYLGGVEISTATALNVGAKGVARRFVWDCYDAFGTSPYAALFSEFTVADVDVTDLQMFKLSPSAAGTDTDFAGAVASITDDDESTIISADAAGQKSSFTMQTYTGGDAVNAYTITTTVKAGESAPGSFKLYLLIGGVRYYGATQSLAVNQTITATEVWGLDPSDSAAWTAAKVNAAQPGIEAVA